LAKKVKKGVQVLTRKDFQLLAELRAKEAGVLARNGNDQGAYYLGGIAIECALKACIAKQTKRYDFPDKEKVTKAYSHSLTELLKLAELDQRLEREIAKNPILAVNWGVVKGWKVESRYQTSGLKGTDMHTAVSSSDGVLQWIKLHW